VYARGFKSWCEKIALEKRKLLGLYNFSPLDPYKLAKSLDVKIWKPEVVPDLEPDVLQTLLDDSDSWSAFTICFLGQKVIMLNSSQHGARQASNITHEVAHIIIGHNPARGYVSADGHLVVSDYSKEQEEEANWLSGCLLLPREALIYIKRQRLSDEVVQKKYGVSEQMLQYRKRVSGIENQFSKARKNFR